MRTKLFLTLFFLSQTLLASVEMEAVNAMKFYKITEDALLDKLHLMVKESHLMGNDFYREFCKGDVGCQAYVELQLIKELDYRRMKGGLALEAKDSSGLRTKMYNKVCKRVRKELQVDPVVCKNDIVFVTTASKWCKKATSDKKLLNERFMSFGYCFSVAIDACLKFSTRSPTQQCLMDTKKKLP